MKLIVAGQDRTQDLGQTLRHEAEAMERMDSSRKPAEISSGISALALRHATSDADYLNELIRLLRYRHGVDTLDFKIPGRRGPRGWLMIRIKKALWKLLRYQHDRIAFRQNWINAMLFSTLEFEIAARRKEVAELSRQVAQLEQQSGGKGGM